MAYPPFAVVGVGSLPFTDEAEALAHVAGRYSDAPFAPELPKRPDEPGMVAGWWPAAAVRTVEAGRVRLSGPPESFLAWLKASDPAAAPAFEVRARRAAALAGPTLQIHVCGPVTLLRATEVDGVDGELWRHPRMREPAATFVAAVAARLSAEAVARGSRALVVLDEPLLTAPAVDVDNPANVHLYASIVDAARAAGGEVGLHSCAEPPAPLLLYADVAFAHFDAVRYGADLARRARTLERFLRRGGSLGLGVLDAREEADDVEAAVRRVRALLPATDGAGILLGPTCGTGLATPDRERRLAAALADVRRRLLGDRP
ncbi:MAG TPA: hypothetical protein VEI02_04890 [Planctomycetota bacterium]|nr:hypothetical protein [Planctomycetota bacterium]